MNKGAIASGKSWLRLTGLLLGFGILVWLPVEDQSELGVLIFSAALCTWIAARFLINPAPNDKQLILRHIFVGSGAGLVLAPLSILLMAIKSGIHGHGTPDFTVAQMGAVLMRTPYFVLTGLLLGLGSGILRLARMADTQVEG